MQFFVPGDLDLQTCPSEGPDTSSVWIWLESVQRFLRYFIHKQKKPQTDGAKEQNLPQFTVCGKYSKYSIRSAEYI